MKKHVKINRCFIDENNMKDDLIYNLLNPIYFFTAVTQKKRMKVKNLNKYQVYQSYNNNFTMNY